MSAPIAQSLKTTSERAMNRIWTLVILASCFFVSGAKAQTAADPDQRIWTVEVDSRVMQYGISRTGVLFVLTKKAIAGWRVDSGQEAWRVELPLSDLAILGVDTGIARNGKGLVALDLDTGERLWTLEALPLSELKGILRATDNVAFAFGPVDEKTFRVIGFEFATGRVIWSSDSIAAGDGKAKDVFLFTYRVALPDSTLILAFNRGGIVRVDATTGAVLWRLDPKLKFSIGWPPANGLEQQYGFGSAEPLVSGDYMVTTSAKYSR
jgi:outer membrane protein assembly factor BamB